MSGEKTEQGTNVPGNALGQSMWLRLPKGTDIQDDKNGIGPDIVECPWTSGRFYYAAVVDDIGGGFANEHRFCVLIPFAPWPVPFPPVGGFIPVPPPPPPPTYLGEWSTGGFVQNSMALPWGAQTQNLGGWLCVYNSTNVPSIKVDGGADGMLSGVGQIGGLMFPGPPTIRLYAFTCPHSAGPNNMVIQMPGFTTAAFCGIVYTNFARLGVTQWDNFGAGMAGNPTTPPYTPAALHPCCHFACTQEINATATTFNSPFVANGTPINDNIGGTLLRFSAADYVAPLAFGYQCVKSPGPTGQWAIMQISFAP